MRRRVVITGIGCVTPVGNDVPSMWESLRRGGNGVGKITHFDAANFPTKFAAEVKNFDLGDHYNHPERFKLAGRNIKFAVAAAMQAVKDSGGRVIDEAPRPGSRGTTVEFIHPKTSFGTLIELVQE